MQVDKSVKSDELKNFANFFKKSNRSSVARDFIDLMDFAKSL